MLELDEIRKLLADMNLTRVADATGVPYGRIWRLVHTDRQPSYDTVTRVVAYLESRQLPKVA